MSGESNVQSTAEGAAEPIAGAEAASVADALPANAGVSEAAVAATLPTTAAVPTPRLGGRGWAAAKRTARVVLGIAIFAGGIAIGTQVFAMNHAPATVAPDPRVATTNPPLLVAELASAIQANDADRIQTVLAPAAFQAYTAEIATNGIASVDAVDILGTWTDGPRSASALVLIARSLEGGNIVAMNLIVVTDNGQIVSVQ